ncbi:GPI ethanolamine phosphate transferase 1-like [Gordionus sp. m RMFG-2023]|uniref:GPI ethanolamine phosphate transferase 1-like n=1 Tax=Gordionus sp. m RMFG-2023 TaxID=3053472 RepID=UPI0031FBD5C8
MNYLILMVIHAIFIISIFDLYIKSPYINNLKPINFIKSPICKRLILIVADGLRSATLYNETSMNSTQFLKNICMKEGLCGVSLTHVPTESRPGHVSIFAGIHEDITSIFKGWKENANTFDTIFNESFYSWSWGSPDIMNIINKHTSNHNSETFSYQSSFQDFSMSDSYYLDQWVFDKVKYFLEIEVHKNQTLNMSLNNDHIIMFLHLLGMDMSGHINKPRSKTMGDRVNFTYSSGEIFYLS